MSTDYLMCMLFQIIIFTVMWFGRKYIEHLIFGDITWLIMKWRYTILIQSQYIRSYCQKWAARNGLPEMGCSICTKQACWKMEEKQGQVGLSQASSSERLCLKKMCKYPMIITSVEAKPQNVCTIDVNKTIWWSRDNVGK